MEVKWYYSLTLKDNKEVILKSDYELLNSDVYAIKKRLNYIYLDDIHNFSLETFKDSESLLRYLTKNSNEVDIIDLIFDAVDSYDIADFINNISKNEYLDFSVNDFIVVVNSEEEQDRYIVVKVL